MDIFQSIVLGALEGLTEFLPVSSTGHLILASELMGIAQDSVHKTFEVVIQLGSILAVVFFFKDKIFKDFSLWTKLAVAFIPTGALGLLLYKHIKELFSADTVAYMLIIGGIIIIAIEYFRKDNDSQIASTDEITYKKAFLIGCFQSLAMVPGTSRSAATIVGGLLLGLNRKTAAEFSFLLAVPTMFIASGYDIYKNHEVFNFDNWIVLGVGFTTAFIFSYIAIKTLMNFISKISFIPFGIYRIILGVVFLYYLGII
jgi:undecaprenyl-diphosphatase